MEKIAFLIHKLECQDFTSGGEKVNFLIIKALSELGCEVDVYCNKSDTIQNNYIKNIFINSNELLHEQLKQNQYSLTMTENFKPADISYIHQNSRTYRETIVRTKLEIFIKGIFSPKKTKEQAREQVYEKHNIVNAKKIIVPSSFIKNDLVEYLNIPSWKVEIVCPPVKLNYIPELQPERNTFTFGLVARSFELKGGYECIISTAILKAMKKDIKTKIIVQNQHKSRTIKTLKFFIKLSGLSNTISFIDYNNSIEDFYSSIDCLVMPSKREAFGLVAAEAMCLGLPVIINDRCGISDYIKNGYNGFVYNFTNKQFRNISSLTKGMKYLVDNPHKIADIKINAQKTSEEFSYEKFKEKLKMVLQSLK